MAGMGIFLGIFGLITYLFMILLPVALLVALQVWLCKKSVRLGLILPGISLAISLLLVLSAATFSTLTIRGGNTVVSGGAEVQVPAQEGDYIEIPAQEGAPREKIQFYPRGLLAAGGLFLVTSIPTVVFGGIWLRYKGRRDTYEDLKRMRIEDLE